MGRSAQPDSQGVSGLTLEDLGKPPDASSAIDMGSILAKVRFAALDWSPDARRPGRRVGVGEGASISSTNGG